MVHEDYKEMIPARALSALDRAEDRALSEHLSACPECRQELEEWQSTSATLALVANPAKPSPQLRDRILSEIRSQAQSDLAGSAESSVRGAQILPFTPAPRNIWRSVGSLGTIAAAILFVAVIISVVVLWRENRAAKTEVARLTREMESTQQKLARAQELSKLLTSPGARMAALAATKEAPGAKAMLAYDRTGHAMLMANGLPAAPSGKEYQLWYIVDNKPMPGNVFTPDKDGNGTIDAQLPPAALEGAVFAITMEPAGGMPKPTGPIYLVSGS